jgi:hypothetical protein
MPQTYYTRPNLKWVNITAVVFAVVYLVALVTRGPFNPPAYAAFAIVAACAFLTIVLDPETTYQTRRVLDDGREVRVRRPLVGFRSLEETMGANGGYEVRVVDGFRYEEALIRI